MCKVLKHLGIMSSSIDEKARAPSYEDIFCPPKGKDRDPKKLYGKELLEKKWRHHHSIMLDNYCMDCWWFCNVSLPSDLRHNQKGKHEIMQIIGENYSEIRTLSWSRTEHKWRIEDIYKWVVSGKQSKTKYKKTKVYLLPFRLY